LRVLRRYFYGEGVNLSWRLSFAGRDLAFRETAKISFVSLPRLNLRSWLALAKFNPKRRELDALNLASKVRD